MMQFINDNLKYPADASRYGIQGTVLVRFIVQNDGKITNATVVRNLHPLLDAEALRVIKLMPDWTPAIKEGKAVNVYFTMPIRFVMRK